MTPHDDLAAAAAAGAARVRRLAEADDEHDGVGRVAREWADMTRSAVEALGMLPSPDPPADAGPVTTAEALLHDHETFLVELHDYFEDAGTDTSRRVAARIAVHLDVTAVDVASYRQTLAALKAARAQDSEGREDA